ncbi:hypothetical protein ACFFTM_22245 [Pseudoduganella plicata]|nr:hypothetical protein [Pseudoduganella plicata]
MYCIRVEDCGTPFSGMRERVQALAAASSLQATPPARASPSSCRVQPS